MVTITTAGVLQRAIGMGRAGNQAWSRHLSVLGGLLFCDWCGRYVSSPDPAIGMSQSEWLDAVDRVLEQHEHRPVQVLAPVSIAPLALHEREAELIRMKHRRGALRLM